MSDNYFYYAEVSRTGEVLKPVWVGDGIAERRTGTLLDLRTTIGAEVLKHASSVTGLGEHSLSVILKQFNKL